MENHLLNTISNSNISKNVNIKNNSSQTNTQLFNVSANLMPSERQTSLGVTNPGAITKSNLEMKRFTSQRLSSKWSTVSCFFRKFSCFQSIINSYIYT